MAQDFAFRALLLMVAVATSWSFDECFSEENKDVQDCYVNNRLAAPFMPSYISATLTMTQNLQGNCRSPQDLKHATQCAFYAVRNCVVSNEATKQFVDFVPLPSSAEKAVEIACFNLTYWNGDCFENEGSNFIRCITDYVQSLPVTRPFGERLCAAFNQSDACLQTTVSKCGCATLKILLDIRKSMELNPCGPTAHVSVQCDPQNPLRFESGSSTLSRCPCWMLIMLAMLGKLIITMN